MKYMFIEEHRVIFRLKKMCKVLKVSRSGYYAWRKRMPSKRQKANKWLLERIEEVYKMSRRIYGSPRITDGLNDQGIICGKNRVAKIMKDNSIRAKVCRKFKKTTNSRHSYPASANLLLDVNEKGRIWVSDTRFILTREGWMYVAAVMDVHSRKILGLSIKDRLTQELTTDALKQAVRRQSPCKGLIHHSDRAKQNASYEYRDLLKRYGIRSSMSRSGNCYDNAHIESFWGTMKRELVYGERYQTREDARLSIFEYIEVFDNRTRKHSALGYKSPEQYGKLVCTT